jgi:hypothetical protein
MSNHYRGPSIDASFQVAVHLDEEFQKRRLKCEKLTDDGRRGIGGMYRPHIDPLVSIFYFVCDIFVYLYLL